MLSFLENSAPTSPIYLPTIYAPILVKLLQPLQPRIVLHDAAPLPTTGTTQREERYYESVQTWKFFVHSIGADWPDFAAEVVAEAKRRGVVSLQLILNMACPQLDAAVQTLKSNGFFFGGLAPRWFGPDGLLMQQVLGNRRNTSTSNCILPLPNRSSPGFRQSGPRCRLEQGPEAPCFSL